MNYKRDKSKSFSVTQANHLVVALIRELQELLYDHMCVNLVAVITGERPCECLFSHCLLTWLQLGGVNITHGMPDAFTPFEHLARIYLRSWFRPQRIESYLIHPKLRK